MRTFKTLTAVLALATPALAQMAPAPTMTTPVAPTPVPKPVTPPVSAPAQTARPAPTMQGGVQTMARSGMVNVNGKQIFYKKGCGRKAKG